MTQKLWGRLHERQDGSYKAVRIGALSNSDASWNWRVTDLYVDDPASLASTPVGEVAGWKFEIEGDTARVVSPVNGPGFTVVAEQSRNLSDRLLFALAKALAASPAPAGGQVAQGAVE